MIANLMASSVSLISATEKKAKQASQVQPPKGATQHTHADFEPKADKIAENISQEDTSDGQGRESATVLASQSPELSSPKMPLSPMQSHGKRPNAGAFLPHNTIGADQDPIQRGSLSYYGLVDTPIKDMRRGGAAVAG